MLGGDAPRGQYPRRQEDPAIVFLDYAHASGFLEKTHEIRQHTSVFGVVTAKALDPDDSRHKIAEIAGTFA
ncbi:MAG: hypothetical protein JO364_06365 [Pseudonocardiales bacterium]|nr:hypothetical protein [Pseudonocardiales bacterium]MBV9029925.1 hypothetical protein [Pseudonocardiales bacterium]